MVNVCTEKQGGLPEHKPRYCMGVGYAVDLVVCAALGTCQEVSYAVRMLQIVLLNVHCCCRRCGHV